MIHGRFDGRAGSCYKSTNDMTNNRLDTTNGNSTSINVD